MGAISVIKTKADFRVTSMSALQRWAADNGLAGDTVMRLRPQYEAEVIEHLVRCDSVTEEQFDRWVCDGEPALADGWERALKVTPLGVVSADTGELVPGVEAVPPRYKGIRVTGCKPEDVAAALPALAPAVWMLEGGR